MKTFVPVQKQCLYCGDDFTDRSMGQRRIYCNRSCRRKYSYQHNEEYRKKNLERTAKWREGKQEYLKEYHKKYYTKNAEKYCSNRREYYQKNKEKCIQYATKYKREKYNTDPIFKLKIILRSRLRLFLKQNNCRKGGRSFEIFGATPEQIKSHIESQFKDDMTWENQGEWHIDHIIPLDYYSKNFDLNNLEVQKKAFNYKNLQPLWAFENLAKSNKRETLELVK